MTTSARRDRPPGASGVGGPLLAVAVLLVALNLRGPIVAVAPVVDAIRTDLGVSSAVAGLLTSLPVLMFALASTPASWLTGRIGPERAMLVGLAVLGVGTVLRSVDGVVTALLGTAMIGAGITVGNVVVPVVIGRDFPHRSGGLLGLYVATMNVGSMITLSVTVPIADGVGWRWALTLWLLVSAASAVVWAVATRGRRPGTRAEPGDDGAGPPTSPWRRPVGWQMLLAFGAQAFSYYGLTAWLPENPRRSPRALPRRRRSGLVDLPGHGRGGGAGCAADPPPHGEPAGGVRPGGRRLVRPADRPAGRARRLAVVVRARRRGPGRRLHGLLRRDPGRLEGHGGEPAARRVHADRAYLLGSLGPFVLGALHTGASWTPALLVVVGVLVVLSVSGWLGASPHHRHATQ